VTLPAFPILFDPLYKETIWGGHALGSRYNRPVSPDRVIGESWEIVSHGADQSIAKNGSYAGKTLGTITAEAGQSLLGKIETFGKFPLLAKFIDAQERLSVQVHPSDGQARTHGWGEFGKTECWYIIDAKKDATLIAGFKAPVTREAINHAIETNSFENLLSVTPIHQGDVVFLPAGMVHAIMEGTLVYEVEETSDATLRLYDWGRVDAAGKPRPLHVREALGIIDTRALGNACVPALTLEENGYRHSYRLACRYFALEHYAYDRPGEIILPAKQSFRILTVLSGGLELKFPAGAMELSAGMTVLLPAILHDVRAIGAADTEMILSSVPDLLAEIITPLKSRGIPLPHIISIGGVREYNDLVRFAS
jgi:mannose-6-phosphate isomerase